MAATSLKLKWELYCVPFGSLSADSPGGHGEWCPRLSYWECRIGSRSYTIGSLGFKEGFPFLKLIIKRKEIVSLNSLLKVLKLFESVFFLFTVHVHLRFRQALESPVIVLRVQNCLDQKIVIKKVLKHPHRELTLKIIIMHYISTL